MNLVIASSIVKLVFFNNQILCIYNLKNEHANMCQSVSVKVNRHPAGVYQVIFLHEE